MRGSVRKRGSSWTVIYDEGRGEDGKRRQRWRGGFPTRRAAEEELRRILRSVDQGDYIRPEKLTYGRFVDERWLPVIETTLRRTTLEAYRRNLRLHVRPAIGGVQLQKLDAATLDRLWVDLGKGRDGRKALSPNTVRFIAALVSSSLDFAERKGLVSRNVAKRSDPPRWEKRQPRTWSARELGVFLEHVRDDEQSALWRFLAFSGARRGEALGLTWLGLDLEAGTALISQQVVPTQDGLEITRPKTESGTRLVTLDAETVRILRAHRQRQVALRGLLDEAYVDHDLVSCKPDGSPLDPRGVSQRFRTLQKAAGLPPIRLHDLRHGVATMGLQAGVSVEVVRRRLGHSNISTTLQYTHAAPEVERQAAETLARLVDGEA